MADIFYFEDYETFEKSIRKIFKPQFEKKKKIYLTMAICGNVTAPSTRHKHFHVPFAFPKELDKNGNIMNLGVCAIGFNIEDEV